MNKKFLSAILFGALMVTSTGTFVSCKDYDDEIDEINAELVDIKSQISALQNKIDAGKYVTNVTKNGEGIVVTWNDGTSSTIETIKGDKGEKGDATQVTIDPVTKNWLVDGVDTGVCAEGKAGEAGEDGEAAATPIFTIGEDGHLYVQYGEDGEKEDLGVSTGGIYYVEDGPAIKLHICDEEGNWKDIVLPQTAAISNIDIVGLNSYYYDDNTVPLLQLVYGRNTTGDAVTFNGKTYAKDALLTNAESVVTAQVNPTMADATLYDFYLTDSEGNSIFDLGTATAYKTVGPISRVDPTPNKGVYNFPVTIKAGTTFKAVDEINRNILYAIATKDAYDNEVLSKYAIKIQPITGSTSFNIDGNYEEVEVGKAFDLNTLVSKTNVIDTKYSFATDQTAAVDAANASISGSLITGTVVGKSVKVTVTYLKNDGTVAAAGTITIKFIAAATVNAYTKTITPRGDANGDGSINEDLVVFDLTSIFGNTASSNSANISSFVFTEAAVDKNVIVNNAYKAYAKDAVAPGFGTPFITVPPVTNASGVQTGYYAHYAAVQVEAGKVIPGTYTAKVTYGSSPVNTVTLTIVVEDPASNFDFKPLSLYFNGNNAVAYGTPEGTKLAYNLRGLFGINDWTNIKFSETVPEDYKDADNNTWSANAWLEGTVFGKILVDKVKANYVFGGAYEARALKATYTPHNNKNFDQPTYDFNLTIKSSVYEGSLIYRLRGAEKTDENGVGTGVYNYTTGAAKTINVGSTANSVKLTYDEILGTYKTGGNYLANVSDARIVSVTPAIYGDNAKAYLQEIDTTNENWSTGYTIKVKANVTAPADGQTVTCYVRVSVKDHWGMTKTVDVPVTLK